MPVPAHITDTTATDSSSPSATSLTTPTGVHTQFRVHPTVAALAAATSCVDRVNSRHFTTRPLVYHTAMEAQTTSGRPGIHATDHFGTITSAEPPTESPIEPVTICITTNTNQTTTMTPSSPKTICTRSKPAAITTSTVTPSSTTLTNAIMTSSPTSQSAPNNKTQMDVLPTTRITPTLPTSSSAQSLWGTRHVRLVAAKPKLAQTTPKCASPPDATEFIATKLKPTNTSSKQTSSTENPPRPSQQDANASRLAMIPGDAQPTSLHKKTDMDNCQSKKEGEDADDGKPLGRVHSEPNLFNLNDGRPVGSLWTRRQSLVMKKSGEIVKPSLKIPKGSIKQRSVSEPTTPTKFVHFDSHICRVRFFNKVESPESVAGTESEAEEDSNEDDEYDSTADEQVDSGLGRGENHMLSDGRHNGGMYIKLPNFPTTSLYDTVVRPVSVEYIRLDDDATHLCIMIRCLNLAYQKTVTIRYTNDEWSTYDEICGTYHDSIEGGKVDRFLAQLPVIRSVFRRDTARHGNRVAVFHLCVRYIVDGKEFWDNNQSRNYCVIVGKTERPPRRRPDTPKAISFAGTLSKQLSETNLDDYFSLPLSNSPTECDDDAVMLSPTSRMTMGNNDVERKVVLRDAEKTWRQVLAAAKAEHGDDEDEEDAEVRRRRPSQHHRKSASLSDTSPSHSSPDAWASSVRKPEKKSFGGRYDFGASFKEIAANRGHLRRQHSTSFQTNQPTNTKSTLDMDEQEEEDDDDDVGLVMRPRQKSVGFTTSGTASRNDAANASHSEQTPSSLSALSRALGANATVHSSSPPSSNTTTASSEAKNTKDGQFTTGSTPHADATHPSMMTYFTPIISPQFGFGFSSGDCGLEDGLLSGSFTNTTSFTTTTGSNIIQTMQQSTTTTTMTMTTATATISSPSDATRPPSQSYTMSLHRSYGFSLASSPASSPSSMSWIRG
jgi:hypothetical protein